MVYLFCEKFNKKYTREEARHKNVANFLKSAKLTTDEAMIIEKGAKSFIEAWKMTKQDFNTKIQNIININESHLKSVQNLSLLFLLPSTLQEGVCIRLLIHMLSNSHNENVEMFKKKIRI